MKKLLLSLFLVFTGLITYGQSFSVNDLHVKLRGEYNELKKQKIDTILSYYKYCTGCETTFKGKRDTGICEGFLEAFVLWESNGICYIKRINCNETNAKNIYVISSHPIDYFFSHLSELREREKFKFKGHFFPPITVHSEYEELSLLTSKTKYQVRLAREQKTSKNWSEYKWINPSIKLMDLTTKIIQKAILNGL